MKTRYKLTGLSRQLIWTISADYERKEVGCMFSVFQIDELRVSIGVWFLVHHIPFHLIVNNTSSGDHVMVSIDWLPFLPIINTRNYVTHNKKEKHKFMIYWRTCTEQRK